MTIMKSLYIYSNPQIDGKVNPYSFDGDLLFHLLGDHYIYIYTVFKIDENRWCEVLANKKHIMKYMYYNYSKITMSSHITQPSITLSLYQYLTFPLWP